ncbi:MAG: SMP-30/gluconolactonase/LRE family protein [Bryobacteraceae bacterium]
MTLRIAGPLLLLTVAIAVFAAAKPQPVEFLKVERYSEGPVFDYEGNFFVTDLDRVVRRSPDGTVTPWGELEDANGHKVLPDGTHLVCAPRQRAVVHLDASGKFLGYASNECNGQPLRAPNDLTLAPFGGFYFSDPGGSRQAPVGTVHYVDPQGKTHLAAGGMWVPNGLVLSPDAATLYVAETVPNRILKFRVLEGGKLGPVEIFANLPSRPDADVGPDGLAVDTKGNLYVAHLGMSAVQVLSPAGKLLRTLPGGNYDVSNLVFWGPELNELYISGAIGHRSKAPGRVYRLTLPGVRGVSSLLERK